MTPETKGLFGDAAFAKMKKGARVVNVARGGIVHEGDLLAALSSGKVAGAALDVFVDEPNVPPELCALDNVVLTPHMASGTWQTRRAMAELAYGNLQAHFAGKPLLTPV